MLHLTFAAGLRVSELTGLRLEDLSLHPQASILVHGKGRRERCLPLWKQTTAALRAWLVVRGTVPVPELFINARREPMTRAGFEYILEKHVRTASRRYPSLATKRISPHVLRHYLAFLTMSSDFGQRSADTERFTSQHRCRERVTRHSLPDPTGC